MVIQLAEIFPYRGLARLETPAAENAWDDLVQAARLDPSRVLDSARFPPRVVTAYRRAATESAEAPRAELVLYVPSGAVVRIDPHVGSLREIKACGSGARETFDETFYSTDTANITLFLR